MPATSGHDDSLSTPKDELGFSRSQSIGVKDLVEKLAELVEDDDHVMVDLAVKVFFPILYENLLCPRPAVHFGRVAAMVEKMDYAAMVQMDFCQLVVDELQASGDIVYYRPLAGLRGSFDAGPSRHAVFCEPIYNQLPACDVEPPPTRGFTARRMFDTRNTSEQTFVGGKKHVEIDELLVKVLKLSEELPTSGDMLRTIAGFSLASHGPREEDIVVVHNFDCGVVEGLKIAATNIRSSFDQLKDSQEVKFTLYEKDAEHILKEMNRHDAGAADDNAGVECASIHASSDVGLGQKVRQSVGVAHVDVKQGGFVVAGGDGVNGSISVAVKSAKPSLAQEYLHAVAPSQHEDADVDIGKPLENDVPVDSVARSPVCPTSNVVPDVLGVEPYVIVLSKDVAVVRTVENPDNADVDTVGQCSEAVMVSLQPSGETILVISEEQRHEESDTKGKHDCGFYMFQFLQTWDGVQVA
ncbi:hypothetical protein ZWY2020_058305 [Hordeum vulgare]|nr:hypothetical protein ZWY2020_058305 [Hordeum vulgare]